MRHSHPTPQSPLGRLLALAGSLLLVAAGFVFSLVLLAALAVAGLIAWGYLRWRGHRSVRHGEPGAATGTVIEGEAVVVHDGEHPAIERQDRG